MAMENLTAADVAAVTRPNFMGMGGCGMGGFGGGFGGDWILGLIAIAAVFGGGFGGFGGFGGGGRGVGLEVQAGFDTQNILRNQDNIKNGLCDGFYAMNTNNLQAQNQLQRDLCQGFAAINAGIAENRYSAKDCCCETQRAIDGVKYENSQNTCNIINAIHAEGEATRAQLTQNTIQGLRDKLADKDRDIQTRDFQLSQLSQNSFLVNQLKTPAPIPAYMVQNPNCCQNPCGGCSGYNQFA